MRCKILIITLFIGVMIITGTASAGIKGVSKKPETSGNIPITVITGTENQDAVIITSGVSHQLDKKGDGRFEGSITGAEEIYDVIIQVNGEQQPYGHGGCPSPTAYGSHPYYYDFSSVDFGQDSGNLNHGTIFSLDTVNNPGTGVIGICIYPSPPLNTGNGDTLKLLYYPNYWEIKHNNNWNYFGFGRHGGTNIILQDGTTGIQIGSSSYHDENINSANILIHILDEEECSKYPDEAKLDKEDDDPSNTCWRRPGTTTPIPEFPTIALPIAAVLGLVFFFQHRKRKEE